MYFQKILILTATLPTPLFAANSFDITLNYTGDPQYLPVFQNAETIWEQIIPSYIDGSRNGTPLSGITISASIAPDDGPGGILGSAGPTLGRFDNSGYLLATSGQMEFDSADIGSLGANLLTVVLHEMGHVIGLGTLWTQNGLYTAGSGQYTGVNGLAAYQAEFNQASATFVPVELGGGLGTANSHWNEVDGGSAATGLVSTVFGSDMRYELMTGWLNTNQPYFISNLTRGSLRDLGYDVALVPEASGTGLAVIASTFILRRRRVTAG